MKLNYSIRCTREQKELIQKHSKETGLTVIDSLLKAIEQYNYNEELNSIENRMQSLAEDLDKRYIEMIEKLEKRKEETIGIKMFDDEKRN